MAIGSRILTSAAVIVAVGLAACGDDNSSATPAGQPNGEADRPAARILTDTAAALGRVHSFHINGAAIDLKGAPLDLSGDFALPGKMRMRISDGSQRATFVLDGGAGYLMANTAFWAAISGSTSAATQLSGHWIKVSPGDAGVAQFAAWANPATIGHCLINSHNGTVTAVGTSTSHGQPVVVLRDQGNLPGTQPGKLYVATTGEPLPLRAVQSGPDRPGGAPDRTCGETTVAPDTTKHGVTRISAYNQPVHITAPQGATTARALLSTSG